jgi:hypothetical protein
LLALLELELGLRLGHGAAVKLMMRVLDGTVEVVHEASLLRQLLLFSTILVVHLPRELLLCVVLVEAFDEHGVVAVAIVCETGHVQAGRATEAVVQLAPEVVSRVRLHGLVAEDRLILSARCNGLRAKFTLLAGLRPIDVELAEEIVCSLNHGIILARSLWHQ